MFYILFLKFALYPLPSLSYVISPVSYIVCYLVCLFHILHFSCVPCHVLFPMADVKFPLSGGLLTQMLYCFSRQKCAIQCAFFMFTYCSLNSCYFLCHMPYVIYYMLYIICPSSYVLYDMSYFIYHMSYFICYIYYCICCMSHECLYSYSKALLFLVLKVCHLVCLFMSLYYFSGCEVFMCPICHMSFVLYPMSGCTIQHAKG